MENQENNQPMVSETLEDWVIEGSGHKYETFKVDFDKVTTVDDIKLILEFLQIEFKLIPELDKPVLDKIGHLLKKDDSSER